MITLNTTLDKFFDENYDKIIKMGRRIVKRRDEGEEVAAFCIEKFLQHKRRDELIEKGEAMLFLSGMIYRSYHYATSQYSRLKNQKPGTAKVFGIHEIYESTLAKLTEEYDDYDSLSIYENDIMPEYINPDRMDPNFDFYAGLADQEYDKEEDLKIEAIQGIMEDMEADTVEQWFRVKLFKMWLDQPNYSELSRITHIPRTTISQAVNECKEYIKKRIENGNNT